MSRSWGQSRLMLLSVLLCFVLALWPMPDYLAPYRPNWLALVLCYWVLEAPGRVGLGLSFVIGVLADLVFGTLLGEQALRLCVVTFIVLRFRPRLHFFTLLQQALAVLVLLLNDRVVVLMIRVLSGEGLPPWTFWISPLVGAMVWPWLYLILDDLRLRWRGSSS